MCACVWGRSSWLSTSVTTLIAVPIPLLDSPETPFGYVLQLIVDEFERLQAQSLERLIVHTLQMRIGHFDVAHAAVYEL